MDFKAEFENLSPEEKQKYREIGEHVFSEANMKLMQGKGAVNLGQPSLGEDAIKQRLSELKMLWESGLNPEDMDPEDLNLLKERIGEDWEDIFSE